MVTRRLLALKVISSRLWRPLGFFLLVWLSASSALAHDIAVITSRAQGLEREVADSLVAANTGHRLFLAGDAEHGIDSAALKTSSLIVALGANAAQTVMHGSTPVLVALVTENEFARIRSAGPEAPITALYLDQPPERHLALLRAAMPRTTCLGVLFGPDSQGAQAGFEASASRLEIALRTDFAASARDVLPVIERMLGRCNAVLTLPDAVVSNPTVARALLLTSYRMQRPLFAYSRAWVEAGALAAVFSTPATATRDLLEWLDGLTNVQRLPPPRNARHFDIAVNTRVARALNLTVPDEDTLRAAVAAGRLP